MRFPPKPECALLPCRCSAKSSRARRQASRPCVSAWCFSPTAWSRNIGGPKGAARQWKSARRPGADAPHRQDMVFLQGPVQRASGARTRVPHLGRIPNLLSGALGQHRAKRYPRRQDDGPGPGRLDRRASVRRSQPRRGHRTDRAAARRRPVDDLRLDRSPGPRATKPATKEIYPARVFDLLVGDGSGRRLDRSILDQVLEDASRLKAADQLAPIA
jgi:hypothetical protein